jgi:hypothetical protein
MKITRKIAKMSLLSRIFFSSTDQRLRAGWRILGFLLLLGMLMILLPLGMRLPLPDATLFLYKSLAVFAPPLLAAWAACRWLDRRPLSDLGLQGEGWQAAVDLTVGLLAAGLAIGIVALAQSSVGWLSVMSWVTEQANSPSVRQLGLKYAGEFLSSLSHGWLFALVFTGYLTKNLVEGLGNRLWAGAALAALGYSLLSYTRPVAALNGWLLMMVLFYTLQQTRRLWLAVGLAAGMQYTHLLFYGSGQSSNAAGLSATLLYYYRAGGPTWLTGGEAGLNRGLLFVLVLAASLLLVTLYTRRRATLFVIKEPEILQEAS